MSCISSTEPDACAPASDQEIMFIRGTVPSTDPHFLWNYNNRILSIDGSISTSGPIASGVQVEGSFLAPMALGVGSFNFTPPSGYGGIVYRGGSIFYYWNNSTNSWHEIDLEGAAGTVGLAHNGINLGGTSTINFVDNTSVYWTVGLGGIYANSTGNWQSDNQANGFGLYNLGTLQVNTAIFYKGQPIEDFFGGGGGESLWSLNPDFSIYRNSNVYIYGAPVGLIGDGPLTVTSYNQANYFKLGVTGAGEWWVGVEALSNGVLHGELGWDQDVFELWTTNRLVMQGIDATGIAFFPVAVGIGDSPNPINQYNSALFVVSSDRSGISCTRSSENATWPTFFLGKERGSADSPAPVQAGDGLGYIGFGGRTSVSPNNWGLNGAEITAQVVATGTNYLAGRLMLCTNDGTPNQEFAIPRIIISELGYVGVGFLLPSYKLDVDGDVNSTACYRINTIPFACSSAGGGIALSNITTINGQAPGGSQTPWLSNIDAAQFQLNNIPRINFAGPGNTVGVVSLTSVGFNFYSTTSSLDISCPLSIQLTAGTVVRLIPAITSGQAFIVATATEPNAIITTAPGNTGLGVNNPVYRLDVAGDVNISGTYRVNGVPLSIPVWQQGSGGVIYYNGGSVGIGNSVNLQASLEVITPTTSGYAIRAANPSANLRQGVFLYEQADMAGIISGGAYNFWHVLAIEGADLYLNRYTGRDVLISNTASRLGIGTATPLYKLDIRTPGSTGGAQLHISNTDTDAGGWLNSAADSQLILMGGVIWSGSAWIAKATEGIIQSMQGGGITWLSDAMLTVGAAYSPTTRMVLSQVGNLGIGTGGPFYRLDVRTPGNTMAQLHIASTDTDSGGYINSQSDESLHVFGGMSYSGSAYIAKAALASAMYLVNAQVIFSSNANLTPGAAFSPTTTATIDGAGLHLPAGAHIYIGGVQVL